MKTTACYICCKQKFCFKFFFSTSISMATLANYVIYSHWHLYWVILLGGEGVGVVRRELEW